MLTFSFPLQSTGSTSFFISFFAVGCVSCSSVAWLLLCSLCSESQILVPVKLSSALQGRGNLSERDYNLALIVPGRFSQQHKYSARALYFLLNAALMRISWWDMHLFLHFLDLYNLDRGLVFLNQILHLHRS